MKRLLTRRIFIGLGAVGLAFVGFATVRMVQHRHHAAWHQEKGSYYCPMHPTYSSDRPGDCPICNMKLVKRDLQPEGPQPMESHPAASPGYAPVTLSPKKQQLIGVKTTVAKRQMLTKTIRTSGRIAFDPELYQAEAEYLEAMRALKGAKGQGNDRVVEQAEGLVRAGRMRLRLLGLSESLIDEMAGWEAPDESLLVADASGRVWLYAPVYQSDLPYVKENQAISIEIPSVSGKRLEGVIRSVDPVLDAATRSARVRALLTDPEGFLKPQMYVNASIIVPLGEVLAVPQEAVFDTGTRRILFVLKGEGDFEPRQALVGTQADGLYEIKSGVEEGEAVVTQGNFLIDSESRLKAALEGAGSTGHSHGP